MKSKLQIDTRVRRLIHYISDLENGLLQIPAFQRDFIWQTKNKLDLFDSLRNGYPIGSILLWKPSPDQKQEVNNKIGPYTVPAKNENFFYILDGFQRLSTILGCFINPKNTKLQCDEELRKREFLIYYDLDKEEFILPRTANVEIYQVPVFDLIDTRAAFALERKLRSKNIDEKEIETYIDRYTQLGTTMIDYQLPCIDIIGGEIEDVVEIFSRVNSKGAEISPDWMVSALTYNNQKDFRLGSEIDNLVEELKIYNFQEVRRELILQCITNSFGKAHFDQSSKIEALLKQEKDNFIEVARMTIGNIKKAVRFLFEELLVVDSKLLPYGIQLIFCTDFFNQIENPSRHHLEKLKRWFWITTYANYFTIYSLSKQREAYNQFQKFIKDEDEDPVYNDRPSFPFDVALFPNKIFFGSVRAKSLVLFMLNYSNRFQKVDTPKIEGLKLGYLFYDLKDERGNFYPESTVAILDGFHGKLQKSKDLSFLLENFDPEYVLRYFITKEMTDIYNQKNEKYQIKILEKRKKLLIKLEREYVEKDLGLTY